MKYITNYATIVVATIICTIIMIFYAMLEPDMSTTDRVFWFVGGIIVLAAGTGISSSVKHLDAHQKKKSKKQ